MIKAVIFDFGHTISDENIPLDSPGIQLMPGIKEVLSKINLRMGIWANTKNTTEYDIRTWLKRAEIDKYFTWIITSVDAGFRKPDKRFFDFALEKCHLEKDEVILVGNQLNSDIQGAKEYGIKCIWLSGDNFRSPDETETLDGIQPDYSINSFGQLPELLEQIIK